MQSIQRGTNITQCTGQSRKKKSEGPWKIFAVVKRRLHLCCFRLQIHFAKYVNHLFTTLTLLNLSHLSHCSVLLMCCHKIFLASNYFVKFKESINMGLIVKVTTSTFLREETHDFHLFFI